MEEMLEVSRVTVRKSLEILEDDGLIVRQVGRVHGTFTQSRK